jgi:hypothetical protein
VTAVDERRVGPADTTAGTWTWVAVLLTVLVVVLPWGLARFDPTRLGELAIFLAYVITVYAALRLCQLYVTGEARIVELGFFVFVYLFMGLAPLAQLDAGRFPLRQEFEQSVQVEVLITTLVGLAGYQVGQMAVRARVFGVRIPRRVEQAQASPARTWMLAAVGFVAVAVVTATSGGLGVRFSSRFEAERALFGDSLDPTLRVDQAPDKALALVKGAFLSLPVFFALLLLLYLQHCARRRGVRDRLVTGPAATLLLVGLVVANVVANNPLSTSRMRVGIIAFALVCVLVPPDTVRRFRITLLAVVFLLIVVFPYADLFRYDVSVEQQPIADELVDGPDYGMFNQDMNTVVYVDGEGHTGGEQLLGAIGSLVPRRIWADKPIATGDLVSRSSDEINASSTLWSEGYIDGGRVGVLVVFVLWGGLSRLLSTAYVTRDRRRPVFAGAVVPVFAGMQLFVVRGALQPTMADLWPLILMTAFCFPLAPRRGRVEDGSIGGEAAGDEERVPEAHGAHRDGGRHAPLGAARPAHQHAGEA